MPALKRCTVVRRPTMAKPHLAPSVVLPSPDGKFTVEFCEPAEWHMGAWIWKLRLIHEDVDITSRHLALIQAAEYGRFFYESTLQPWSADSRKIAVKSFTGIHLYDIYERTLRLLDSSMGFASSLQWSPVLDRLLVPGMDGGYLFDGSGEVQGIARWQMSELPDTFWMASGDLFFLVDRTRNSSPPHLAFFDSNGEPAGIIDVDPDILLSYKKEAYADLARDQHVLVTSRGGLAVGSLLDTWAEAQFDQSANTLYLSIYRPTGEPYWREGNLYCKVREQWVGIELAP